MTTTERIDELKELKKKSSGNILSDADRFNEWTGRVSGLLGFDLIARHKFDALCDYIHSEQDGGRWQLYENVIQAENKMQAIVARAISDLEINRPYAALSLPENFSIPDPVIIPEAAGFGYPETDFALDTDRANIIQKDQFLTGEHGFLWFWHHCHYSIKWRIIYSGLPLLGLAFFLGWKTNKYSFFQKVGSALHEVVYGEESTYDKDDSPKKTPSQP